LHKICERLTEIDIPILNTAHPKQMQELHTLETSALVDMLALHTAEYTKMLKEGALREDFATNELTIKAIQTEIYSRKRTEANTSTTDQNIILQPD
jgi:hypothetical protein